MASRDPDSTPWNGLFTLARAILKEAFRVRAIRPSIGALTAIMSPAASPLPAASMKWPLAADSFRKFFEEIHPADARAVNSPKL